MTVDVVAVDVVAVDAGAVDAGAVVLDVVADWLAGAPDATPGSPHVIRS